MTTFPFRSIAESWASYVTRAGDALTADDRRLLRTTFYSGALAVMQLIAQVTEHTDTRTIAKRLAAIMEELNAYGDHLSERSS